MPDDQNTISNTLPSDSNPVMGSEPVETPPEAPEAPINADNPVSLNDDNGAENPPVSIPENDSFPAGEAPDEPIPATTQSSGEAKSEPIQTPEPISIPSSGEAGTGQIPVYDPLPVSTSPKPSQKDLWKRFLDKVQIGKRKKLEKIMTLFLKQSKITNDEVEKFLRVSDKTAERYLNALEQEGKIKRNGKTGHMVSYSRI